MDSRIENVRNRVWKWLYYVLSLIWIFWCFFWCYKRIVIIMANRIRAVFAGLGLILTGIILSSYMPERLPEIRMFGKEIFRTNCIILCRFASIQSVRRVSILIKHHNYLWYAQLSVKFFLYFSWSMALFYVFLGWQDSPVLSALLVLLWIVRSIDLYSFLLQSYDR